MVQFTSFLATALALATTTHAVCYSGGPAWQSKATAEYHARRACYGYDGVKGALQDVYFQPSPVSTLPATVCVNGDGDFHIIFQIANRLSGRKLPNNICFDGLNAEIQGCGNGGENVREGWWIRTDPQSGRC